MSGLRLKIEPVIQNADDLRERIIRLLPGHDGLPKLAAGVANAARAAQKVSRELKRPFGIHRLPVMFLTIALVVVFVWLCRLIGMNTELSIALPDRDAQELRERVSRKGPVQFTIEPVDGSREASEMVSSGKVDLAFVQGGLPISHELPRLETRQPEYVLWFLRDGQVDASHVRRILTSVNGEGSHTVAQVFMKAWKIDQQVSYVHDWKDLSKPGPYTIPDDIDAVFVVKDPSDEKTLIASEKLAAAGFRLAQPYLGARADQVDYLKPTTIPKAFLQSLPPFPSEPTETYLVSTYLVGRRNLTARMLSIASELIEGRPPSMADGSFDATVGETSEVLQGVEAFMGILINIGLAFLAMVGFEMMAYRKRFHELNSLVSLISIHQSTKDVLGTNDPRRRQNNLLYLSLCSDLLGLVSAISGYYTQENSSLLFNNLPEIIHQRCDGLKINIQLKILHAMIRESEPDEPEVPEPPKVSIPSETPAATP